LIGQIYIIAMISTCAHAQMHGKLKSRYSFAENALRVKSVLVPVAKKI